MIGEYRLDPELERLFVQALEAAEFLTWVAEGGDNFHRLEVSGKMGARIPPGIEHIWAMRRVRGLLREVEHVAVVVATRLDSRRGPESVGVPSGVRGRPTTITAGQIEQVRRMRATGMSVNRVACSGVMPRRTFYRALERGRGSAAGPDRELWTAVYDQTKRAEEKCESC